MRNIIIAGIIICFLAGGASSRTWIVRQDGTGDTIYLAYALYYAEDGDTILVGPGLYKQPTFSLGAVHLISESGPESTILELLPVIAEVDVHVIVIEDISSCSIIGFTIRGATGGWLSTGGGIDCINSFAVIRNNIITDNWCASGGGIACYGSPATIIEYNLIRDNSAFSGGGILVDHSSPIIRGNTIIENYASVLGGGIYLAGDSSYPIITNNIIANNGGYTCGGITSSAPSSQVTFTCNDMWNNTPSNYCDSLTDQTGMNGNISADAQFCGVPGSGNYYLQAGSPCAGANVPAHCAGVGMGCYPVNCTVGTRETTWGNIKLLFPGK
jgi:parallel beta-helix repeat protein